MPITRRGRLLGYRWGRTGKIFWRRSDAVRQARAAHAASYVEVTPYRRRTGPVRRHQRRAP